MFMRGVIRRLMERGNVESIITGFVSNIAYIALLAFVVIAALGQLGIQTTSFIAVLGAAGLAIGLALQGSLANIAAGFLMIIFRMPKASISRSRNARYASSQVNSNRNNNPSAGADKSGYDHLPTTATTSRSNGSTPYLAAADKTQYPR